MFAASKVILHVTILRIECNTQDLIISKEILTQVRHLNSGLVFGQGEVLK
jgi:hypothetical protein